MNRFLRITLAVVFMALVGTVVALAATSQGPAPQQKVYKLSKEDSDKYLEATRQLQNINQQKQTLDVQADNVRLRMQLVLTKAGVPEGEWDHPELEKDLIVFKAAPPKPGPSPTPKDME